MIKKLLAITLTLAMVFSLATSALAASTLPDGETPIEGEGVPVGVSKDSITEFTQPTDAAFDFFLDPMGLTEIEDSSKLSELNGGYIVMKGDAPALFTNACGFTVDVEAKVTIIKDSLTIVNDKDLVDDGTTDKNALFYIQPSTVKVVEADNYVPTEKGVMIEDSTGTTLKFAFPAADYTITKSGNTYTAALINNSVQGSGFMVGGYVNPKADYSAVTGAKISVAFKVTERTTPIAPADLSTVSDGVVAFGLLKPGSAFTMIESVSKDKAPTATPSIADGAEWDGLADLTIAFNLGLGELAATAVDLTASEISLENSGGPFNISLAGLVAIESGLYATFDNNVFTLTTDAFDTLVAGSEVSITIAFTDSDKTFTFTFDVAED